MKNHDAPLSFFCGTLKTLPHLGFYWSLQAMQKQNFVMAIVVALYLALSSIAAQAHEIRPSIADFRLGENDRYEISVLTNLEAIIAGIGAEHGNTDADANAGVYNELRQFPPEELSARFEAIKSEFLQKLVIGFDGVTNLPEGVVANIPPVGDIDIARDSVLVISGVFPAGAKEFTWAWPQAYGASVIRMNPAGAASDQGYSAYLAAGETSEAIELVGAAPPTFWQVVKNYITVGFTHIIPKGLDHILFVVGLFLLSTKLRPLLWQITAFTVAHTVTLALGVLGYVSISPAVVEPLIAASIVYVAVENIMTDKLQKWRPVVVFCFGLLHGLGFAGVLGEIGLSAGHFVAGLIAFNVGVELGQLAVITICFATVGYWFGNKPWYRSMISIHASLCIAIIAAWWVYERVFL
jgi:hypothetical protein